MSNNPIIAGINAAFKQHLDKDGTGLISSDQLKYVLREVSGWSDRELDRLISSWQEQGNGKLAYNDFISWLMEDTGDVDDDEQIAQFESLRKDIVQASWCGLTEWQEAIREAESEGLNAGPEIGQLLKARKQKEEAQQEKRYDSFDSLERALASNDTVLLKGRWVLLETEAKQFVVPRRQDLPTGGVALWEPEELMQKARLYEKMGWVEIVAISYCWFTPQHPDPNGEQLRILARAIRLRLNVDASFPSLSNQVVEDIAIFFDFCSMYQKAFTTPEEGEAFKRALSNVNLWYAHHATAVWILSTLSSDFPASLAYDQRGWPTFECFISAMLTDRKRMLDIGKLDSTCDTWEQVAWGSEDSAAVCAAHRHAPCLPREFARILGTKVFTNGADRDFVAGKYAQTFEEVTACVEGLNFGRLKWGDQEIQQLAVVLPHYSQLRMLLLDGNSIGDVGAAAIAQALPLCPSLKKLKLKTNQLTHAGMRLLVDAWVAVGKSKDSLTLDEDFEK